jgi:hypothetical protein
VSHYRLYFRDRDGHFSGCRQLEALSDVQATSRADRMARGFSRELWWESRLFRRWDDGAGNRHFERPPSDLGRVLRRDATSGTAHPWDRFCQSTGQRKLS